MQKKRITQEAELSPQELSFVNFGQIVMIQ